MVERGGGRRGERRFMPGLLLSASATRLVIFMAGIIDNPTPEMLSAYPDTFHSRLLDFLPL